MTGRALWHRYTVLDFAANDRSEPPADANALEREDFLGAQIWSRKLHEALAAKRGKGS
jgi:hypothetical protein